MTITYPQRLKNLYKHSLKSILLDWIYKNIVDENTVGLIYDHKVICDLMPTIEQGRINLRGCEIKDLTLYYLTLLKMKADHNYDTPLYEYVEQTLVSALTIVKNSDQSQYINDFEELFGIVEYEILDKK
jgi:hypothetical protein